MENLKAPIHSIETLGAVDGPGLRFVIFMQGCLLKCKYCHNRDTWDINSGNIYSIDELIKKILRSEPYFVSSNGGVTVSGGEPLLHVKFICELFKELKKYNIHTAIDTAGSIKINEDIAELLKYTDLVILDIKHINNEKCIALTGSSNKNTLEFAKYLSDNNIKMWIRQVLIPTITDDPEDLIKLKEFLSSLKTLDKFEFLPYHNLGKHKWTDLGQKYPLENIRVAEKEDLAKAYEILSPFGM